MNGSMNSIMTAALLVVMAAAQSVNGDSREMNDKHGAQTFPKYLKTGYDQKFRPQFHFSSRKGWLNDPNGMVYLDGEYHLFFQHNPYGTRWGSMTWGHAVSKDMVHWEQIRHAIMPYDKGKIFSGTAVIDHNNSLGKQKEGGPKTLVACFTFARNPYYQAMAYSTDRGRNFTLVNEGKAVLPNQGYDLQERDPKILWHEGSKKWVMILWVKRGKPGKVCFFTSDNLTDWTKASEFDRDWVYECMDFVHLPVDPPSKGSSGVTSGDPKNKKWVLFDADFDYEIGDFDGKTFITDKKVGKGDYGFNYYAAQTFNNSPDGRTVIIGWMRESNFKTEGMPFNQQMSFPCTMELKTTKDGIKIFRQPIKEIEKLYTKTSKFTNKSVAELNAAMKDLNPELIDATIEFDPAAKFELNLRGQIIRYADGEINGAKTKLPAEAKDGKVSLRILLDRGSIELFVNGGEHVTTTWVLVAPDNQCLHCGARPHQKVGITGSGKINSFVLNELKSIWPAVDTGR